MNTIASYVRYVVEPIATGKEPAPNEVVPEFKVIVHPSRKVVHENVRRQMNRETADDVVAGNDNVNPFPGFATYFAKRARRANLLATLEFAMEQLPSGERFEIYFKSLAASPEIMETALWRLKPHALRAVARALEDALDFTDQSNRLHYCLKMMLIKFLGEFPKDAASARKSLRRLHLRHHADKLDWNRFENEGSTSAVADVHQLINLLSTAMRRSTIADGLFKDHSDLELEKTILSSAKSFFLRFLRN